MPQKTMQEAVEMYKESMSPADKAALKLQFDNWNLVLTLKSVLDLWISSRIIILKLRKIDSEYG